MSDAQDELPTASALDHAHTAGAISLAAAAAAAGLIAPAAGAGFGIAAAFYMLLRPPLTRRQEQWMASLAIRLEQLEKEQNGRSIQDLVQDEVFVTTMLQATQVAARTHQREKLKALQNAVLNTALASDLDENKQLIYLNLIDRFTALHIKLLASFNDPKDYGERHNVRYAELSAYKKQPYGVILQPFPELWDQFPFVDMIMGDLHKAGLTRFLGADVSDDKLFDSWTTPLGKEFMQFITSPLSDDNDGEGDIVPVDVPEAE